VPSGVQLNTTDALLLKRGSDRSSVLARVPYPLRREESSVAQGESTIVVD
jgi:hypothetical protein